VTYEPLGQNNVNSLSSVSNRELHTSSSPETFWSTALKPNCCWKPATQQSGAKSPAGPAGSGNWLWLAASVQVTTQHVSDQKSLPSKRTTCLAYKKLDGIWLTANRCRAACKACKHLFWCV